MRYLFIFLIYFTFSSLCIGQNLIQNPSFEDTIRRTTPLFLPIFWNSPTLEGYNYFTPLNDTFNLFYPQGVPINFTGFQYAKDGDTYIGIEVYKHYGSQRNPQREYIQNILSQTLVKDSTYCLRLYMSMADSMVFASKNQLGIYFSTNAVSANNRLPLPYTPQIIISPDSFNTDKENWTEYNFQYKASGGERYMTVGNFNDTNSLDTMFVGGGNQFWMESSYYYLDNFYLGPCDSIPEDTAIGLIENRLESQISLYPNPANNHLFVRYSGNEQLHFRMFNILGEEVSIKDVSRASTSTNMSIATLPKGIYFLEISSPKSRITKKFIKN